MSDYKPRAGSGSGITQLTGDVTAGPGSGSVAASVTRPTSAEVLAVAIATRSLSPLSLKQYVAPQTLTDAATTAFNVALGCNATWTIGGDRLLQNPTNIYPGASGNIKIIQGAGGSHAITFDTAYQSAGSSAIVLSTNAADEDLLSWYSPDGTEVWVVLNNAFGPIP